MAIKMPHIPKNHFAGEERGKTQAKTKKCLFFGKKFDENQKK